MRSTLHCATQDRLCRGYIQHIRALRCLTTFQPIGTGLASLDNMPSPTEEPGAILYNLCLIASWWNFFVFVLNPILFGIWLYYMVVYIIMADNIFPLQAKLLLALSYAIFAGILQYITASKIQARLEKAGYTQRITRLTILDLLMNFIVLAVLYRWIEKVRLDDLSAFWGWIRNISKLAIVWMAFSLMLLGPTPWFTVRPSRRARPL